MKKISIIIPGYNCEKSIKKCLESILNQKNENIDVFFIDDGSTDKTSQMVYEYRDNKHFNYYYQKNSGVSAARNMGIKLSKDYKYLMFVDSDDWIEEKSLEVIMNELENTNVDFLFGDWNRIYLEKNIIMNEKQKINKTFNEKSHVNVQDLINHFISSRNGGAPWAKVYKTSIIMEFNIKFHDELPYAEDYIFNLEYLTHCKNINYLQKEIYNYNCCSEGAASMFRKNYIDLFIKIEEYKSKALPTLSKKQKKLDIYEKTNQLITAYKMLFNEEYNQKERKQYINQIKQYAKQENITVIYILNTMINRFIKKYFLRAVI